MAIKSLADCGVCESKLPVNLFFDGDTLWKTCTECGSETADAVCMRVNKLLARYKRSEIERKST